MKADMRGATIDVRFGPEPDTAVLGNYRDLTSINAVDRGLDRHEINEGSFRCE